MSIDNLTVRRAEPEDAAPIAEVHVSAWRAAYEGLLPETFLASLSVEERERGWRQTLRYPERTVFVAEREDEVVGFASFGKCRDADKGDSVAELMTIYALPDVWGQGVGRALWQTVREAMLSENYLEATLWVLEGNDRALRFYQAVGFTLDGTRKIEEWNGVTLHEQRLTQTLQQTPT